MKQVHVAVIGGGLAGLTASIDLARKGLEVVLFEKNAYPVHKVCGEYLSKEVLPYLNALEIDLEDLNPKKITKLQFSTISGNTLETDLPLGGYGLSRYALDAFLYDKAIENGVLIKIAAVEHCEFRNDSFLIKTTNEEIEAKTALGAFGKRSAMDKMLNRKFIQGKSPWLAVKAHYENPDFSDDIVGLHTFNGGYCGISKTETGAVNFCYLASYKSFEKYKNIQTFNNEVISENRILKNFLRSSNPLFEKPLSIAQISFAKKEIVNQHILLCGDSAGLIHPLCGNGMAMGIHSAKIAAESIAKYFKCKNRDRQGLESNYKHQWNKTFKNRLAVGKKLQSIMLDPKLTNIMMGTVLKNKTLINLLIKKTHGQAF